MVNKVILIGNVGADPEVRHLDNGGVVANFSLATSESYKDKTGERKTNTEWHRIVIWGKVAEITEQYVKKGAKLYIEGKMKTRMFTDDNNNTKYFTEVVLEQYGGVMQMIGGKNENSSSEASSSTPPTTEHAEVPPPSDNGGTEPLEDDDLPF